MHAKDAVDADNEKPPLELIENVLGNLEEYDGDIKNKNMNRFLQDLDNVDNTSIIKDFLTEQVQNLVKIKKGNTKGV